MVLQKCTQGNSSARGDGRIRTPQQFRARTILNLKSHDRSADRAGRACNVTLADVGCWLDAAQPLFTVVSLRTELIEKSRKLHLVATGRQTIR